MWIPPTSSLIAVNVDSVRGSIESLLAGRGLVQFSHATSLWVFFAACGVAELAISFAVCTPLERFWPLTSWPKRNPIAADVTYAFFVRIVLFPLIAYFEFNWLRQALDGFLHVHGIVRPSLPGLIPAFASWPAAVFCVNFAILDLADYWRHRVSHRIGWWYGIHSLHHAEEQLTFWSDDRSHVLEDAITYVWLMSVGLAIGVPGMQFPFLILCFRFLGSISHALWDIAFRTARFRDNTVETGDAGAEPALVNGPWGEQQLAGFRRMIRLARRGKKAPAMRAA